MIHPSPALLVRADTPLGECVQQMRDHPTGVALVIGDDAHSSLVGIFTQRDLLNNIELIQNGNHWERPVRTVMTSPVITIDESILKEAPKLLVKHNIRQIPVVVRELGPAKKVVGIVTARDILLDEHGEKEEELFSQNSKSQDPIPKIFLMSGDNFFSKFMIDTIAALLSLPIQKIDPLQKPTEEGGLLILDIDSFERDTWPLRLKELNQDQSLKMIVLAFSPKRHSRETIATLDKLGKLKKFCVFRKPSEIVTLITRIHKALIS